MACFNDREVKIVTWLWQYSSVCLLYSVSVKKKIPFAILFFNIIDALVLLSILAISENTIDETPCFCEAYILVKKQIKINITSM